MSPQNLDSWKTLLRAAEIRTHAVILDIAKTLSEGEIPHQFTIIENVAVYLRRRNFLTLLLPKRMLPQKKTVPEGHLQVSQVRLECTVHLLSEIPQI